MLTVNELIEMLKLFPQDYPIFHGTSRKYEPINTAITKTIGVVVLTTEVDVEGEIKEVQPKQECEHRHSGGYKPVNNFKFLNYEGK